MRALVLWVAGFLGFAAMGAEKPKFADLRAGDAVVAVVRVVDDKEDQTRRFLIQKKENGWSVSAWNLNDRRFKEGFVGRIELDEGSVAGLDRILGECRASQVGAVKQNRVMFFWQCAGVQREELWVDAWIQGDANGMSLPEIYRAIEKLEQ